MPIPTTSDREIVQERIFDAPRELVWKAFTERAHIDKWWGPNGFRNETSAMDVRVGGVWRYLMHGPDGKDWVNWIRYEEVTEPSRLVYAHGGDTDEAMFHVTITFTELGNRTKLT
ncbi:MAG: SRPBCC domain-containing protein, partial [Deltaproteobacteria bacterium]|nr:SRPBCC domain-containing protein [Deltaproteobacteria bacterium]